MQKIIGKLNEILERFEEDQPVGMRFHTPNRQDFIDLAKSVKQIAEAIQNEGVEID